MSAEGPRFRRHGSVSRYWARLRTHLASSDGRSDGAGASGGAAHIGQWVGRVAVSGQVFGPVGGVGTQPHVRRVGAAGEIAAVTNRGIVGPGLPQSEDHPVGQLVGEPVSRDGAASRRAGKTCRAERSVTCRRPTDPRPAQNSWLLVALRFKARRDDRIFKPGRPALLRNADRPRPAEQKELFYSLQSRSPLTGRR